MTDDAPKRIGLMPDGFGNFALATVDEADLAIHYTLEDHAQAEKEVAVAAEREAIAYEICDMEEHDAEQNDWTDGAWLAKRISSAIRARGDTDALERVRQEVKAEALRVKSLEWWTPSSGNNQTHGAKCALGTYYVHIDGGRHQAWLETMDYNREIWCGDTVGTLEEAKLTAQDDYERRILSALISDQHKVDG